MGIPKSLYLTIFILILIIGINDLQAGTRLKPKRFASTEINTKGMKQLYNEPFNNKDPKTLQCTRQWLQFGSDGSWAGLQQWQKPNSQPRRSAGQNRTRAVPRRDSKPATGANVSQITITPSDISMAKDVIRANTRSLPGFNVGSRIKVGSGKFSASDALVLYMLKFHHQTKVCPPIAVVAEALKKLSDTRVNKKSVAIFWKDYSTSSDLNANLSTPNALRKSFDWYILIKGTERAKIANMRLQGFVGADSAWRKAMNSQHQFWEKSRAREDEFILKRGAYRVLLNSQAAVAAAERAVKSGY